MRVSSLILTTAVLTVPGVVAGPLAYGLCQTGCNTVTVACYAAAGFTFGTITSGVGAPAAIVACNAALGTCSATCAALLLAPTV